MEMYFKVSYKGFVPDAPQRDHNRAVKAGYRAGLSYWHEEKRPQHFDTMAYSLYGAKKRTEKYAKHKKRLTGHERPLVYTGVSEQRTRTRQKYVGTALRGMALTMHAPRLNIRPMGWRRTMREELEVVTKNERRQMAGRFQSTYIAEVKKSRHGRTVRI